MIEIFRTNISNTAVAVQIQKKIIMQYPNSEINFDLEDCDKILRIETKNLVCEQVIIRLGQSLGLDIELLED